jgi:hypothetical protein
MCENKIWSSESCKIAGKTYRELPAGFREPDGTCPYEPTPALLNTEENPLYTQAEHRQSIKRKAYGVLFDEYAPKDVPENVKEMVLHDYCIGDARRILKNHCSFLKWQSCEQALSPELETVWNKLLLGVASPSENLLFMKHTSLESSELTRVIHPYGYRMEHVDAAREVLTKAIEAQDGVLIPVGSALYKRIDIQPNVSCNGNGEARLNGFLVTYKKDIGFVECADKLIRIIERQSAAIMLNDISGQALLDPKDVDVKKMHKIVESYELYSKDEDWRTKVTNVDHFRNEVNKVIQANSIAEWFIPVQTMTYAAAKLKESQPDYRDVKDNMSRALGSAGISLL